MQAMSYRGEGPDPAGQFGRFGGCYMPETLMPALHRLEQAFEQACADEAFWQRYLQLTQAADAEEFGRNLDAFWDALSAQGPGYPGPCTLRVVNTEAIKHWRAGGFLMALEDMAEELPAGHEVQLELVAAE